MNNATCDICDKPCSYENQKQDPFCNDEQYVNVCEECEHKENLEMYKYLGIDYA